jgi:hypothetical protein
MSYISSSYTFTINQPSVALNEGEVLTFRLKISGSTSNNFTASIAQGSLTVSSLAASTGYATVNCPYLSSTYINTGSNSNEIIFSSGLSSVYNGGYTFVPNPLSGSASSSLYSTYGDVDYPFVVNPYDILLLYLSDNTYVEYRILNVYTDSNNLVRLVIDGQLSQFIKDDLVGNGHSFTRFLLLARIPDETNAYIIYTKRPGQTSYGFVIPQNLATDVLANIDTITKEVKQKLLADQQGTTS